MGLAEDGTILYDTKNIEDIQVGDLVYSYNTSTGETELTEVTSTVALSSDHINYLTIVDEDGNEQVIETTDVHPFWVLTDDPDFSRGARDYVDENGVVWYHEGLDATEYGFWVETKDLQIGDVFMGADGELSTLTGKLRLDFEGGIAVFNIEVEGNHNYFILAKEYENGLTCVLVHNAKACGQTNGWGDIGSHDKMHPDTALDRGLDWLDHDYKEIAPGVFRSNIHPERQFRMTEFDLDPLSKHSVKSGLGSHVHFEIIGPKGAAIENLHIGIL